ncbi:polyprenyl synthetase family protein [Natronorubrum sulfidifaciens]|nr:hypothetical protein [Natronorubrum sulfidifaciens]
MTGNTPQQIRERTRSSTDGSVADLPPPFRAVVDESLSSPDESLPRALCHVAGECSDDVADQTEATTTRLEDLLEPVCDAVGFLEGYARLRLAEGVTGDETAVAAETVPDWIAMSPVDRETAILASDFLHASAYERIAKTPVPDDRKLELYRLLTHGSAALASRSHSAFEPDKPAETGVDVAATLAGVAGELGVTAVGGSAETRDCLRRYSRAITCALASQSTVTVDDTDTRATAVAVLSGHQPVRVETDREHDDQYSPPVTTAVERAQTALERLATDDRPSTDDQPATRTPPPLARLEQATRLPFQGG